MLNLVECYTNMRLYMSINYTDLVKQVADKQSTSQTNVKTIVDEFINTLVANVAAGKRCNVYGFGNFESKTRAARTGKNPRTGEEIQVDECNVIKFKAAKKFKEEVNS